MRNDLKIERLNDMLKRKESGFTLQEIGDFYNMSRQRVSKILKDYKSKISLSTSK